MDTTRAAVRWHNFAVRALCAQSGLAAEPMRVGARAGGRRDMYPNVPFFCGSLHEASLGR